MTSGTDLYSWLLYQRRSPIFGRLAYLALKLLGAEIPPAVEFGEDCLLVHGGFGVVVHPQCRFGARVKIYPGVTLGRADVHLPADRSEFEGIQVGDDVVLGVGAKILCKQGILTIGAGSVIGANAVLTRSTGPGEIWAGIPAKLVRQRPLLDNEIPRR
jgi:serine O-acetyltransferase